LAKRTCGRSEQVISATSRERQGGVGRNLEEGGRGGGRETNNGQSFTATNGQSVKIELLEECKGNKKQYSSSARLKLWARKSVKNCQPEGSLL